ncbi:hypothetical protein [Actinosynnema sp. NPDC020468]|uniref:hypothetical protein n=1 Tax=Actinosynnema sp. NPDC020468 TaxID=3154488 RepID=UPI0033F053D9
MSRIRALALAVAATAVLAPTASAATPASDDVTASTLRTVCADDLYVRDAPRGLMIGTLYRDEHIDVERYSDGGWAYGMAYGGVNKRGWVDAQWLC